MATAFRGSLRAGLLVRCTAALTVLAAAQTLAQPPGAGRGGREAAPIDLTGNWVAIVNEDWRWRMVTPPKGDVASVQPLNQRGRAAANAWDPATDGSCKAYGAAGLMRMPTRLRIGWDGDNALVIETDAGRQTRRFEFGSATSWPAARGEPSLQGTSVAEWQYPARRPGMLGFGSAPAGAATTGSLKVLTAGLSEGWLRRNGVPYSEQTRLTEYYDRFPAPNGDEWLAVTTIVEDPVYLNGPFITSSHFRREPDNSKWNPQACRTDD
jgi:hypothetical protein